MVKFKRLSRQDRKKKNSKVKCSSTLMMETLPCQEKEPAAELKRDRLCYSL